MSHKIPSYKLADYSDIDVICNALHQNEPNPFSETTYIKCDISSDVTNAVLYIYNMNGEQIEEYVVTERGKTEVAIDGGMLNPGMYLYALIADGTVVDTKRMILTK
ncbi:MAG: T9SS type A sorting domain-containing protein [Bacteroidaceae bacterium]|nr:T9SS type A sorting domain-containing protein [Bacteroidaceae bacterium]